MANYAKVYVGSGEDAPFVYEPAAHHTFESFSARMKKRMAEARKDQSAFRAEEVRSNGQPILLRDESGFGEAVIPVDYDQLLFDSPGG